jgi:hypothetical protein
VSTDTAGEWDVQCLMENSGEIQVTSNGIATIDPATLAILTTQATPAEE